MVTDLIFCVSMLLTERVLGISAFLWITLFNVVLALKLHFAGAGAWGVLRACTGFELGYRYAYNHRQQWRGKDEPLVTHQWGTLQGV